MLSFLEWPLDHPLAGLALAIAIVALCVWWRLHAYMQWDWQP